MEQSTDTTTVKVPNSEVKPEKKRRRKFTSNYKRRILKEADQCRGKAGAIGALLRREGLFSSTLTDWRKQRDDGGLSALGQFRGRKPKYTETELENQRLRKENVRLQERIRQAKLIIDAQKKIADILGNPIDEEQIRTEAERKMSCER